MNRFGRRAFFVDVGRGMLAATVGLGVARDLKLSPAFAEETPPPLSFGSLEPLAALIEETPDERIVSALVDRLQKGTSLHDLTAAGALASARRQSPSEYNGMHAFLALAPAYAMALQSPKERQALPVLKVVARNAGCIHGPRLRRPPRLQSGPPPALPKGPSGAARRRAAREQADGG